MGTAMEKKYRRRISKAPPSHLAILIMESVATSIKNGFNGITGTNGASHDHDLASQVAFLHKTVQTLQNELTILRDHASIVALLNKYTALHDEAVDSLIARQEWENLFCHDGEANYPFGSHQGRAGMGNWAFGGVSYFERCQLLSSNFHVTFPGPEGEAHVRTNCIAQWLKKKDVFDDHFDEGGFYHWDLKKEDGQWRIKRVHLTITWTTGEDPTGVGPKTVMD